MIRYRFATAPAFHKNQFPRVSVHIARCCCRSHALSLACSTTAGCFFLGVAAEDSATAGCFFLAGAAEGSATAGCLFLANAAEPKPATPGCYFLAGTSLDVFTSTASNICGGASPSTTSQAQ